MLFAISVFLLLLFLILKYAGWVASRVLTYLVKCPFRVEGVGVFYLREVRVDLPNGLSIHSDLCTLEWAPSSSRLCVLRCNDVRVEGDVRRVLQWRRKQKRAPTSNEGSAVFRRISQLSQYCGGFLNRVHLVLLEAVPDCMIHVTVDELSLEAYQSRDSWQLEVICSLLQGKVLRRGGSASGCVLAEAALPLHLSLDVANQKLKKIALRVAEPSISLTSGILDGFNEFLNRDESGENSPEIGNKSAEFENFATSDSSSTESTSIFRLFHPQLELAIALQNTNVKYTGDIAEQSRYMSLMVRQTCVEKRDESLHVRVESLIVADQLLRSTLKTSLLSIEIAKESSRNEMGLKLSSDSVHTALSLQDAIWWKTHFESLEDLRPKVPSSPKSPSRTPSLTCSLEIASVVCQLVDVDAFQSTLSVQYLCFVKRIDDFELAVDSLSFSTSNTSTTLLDNDEMASFEQHNWGQSLYIGVALVQYSLMNGVPTLLLGMDDCKVEWSDRLAQQLHELLLNISHANYAVTSTPSKVTTPRRMLAVKATSKRVALLAVARESSYLLALCDHLNADSTDSEKDIAVSASNLKIGIGTISGSGIRLSELKEKQRYSAKKEDFEEEPSDTKCWSHAEKDQRRAEKRERLEQVLSKSIRVCFETRVLYASLNCHDPVLVRVALSTDQPLYVCWSSLLHSILLHLKNTTKNALHIAPRPGAMHIRRVPRQLQLKAVSTQEVSVDMELPRNHRILWSVPSVTWEIGPASMTATSPRLIVQMNANDIVTATDISITRRPSDADMTSYRTANKQLRLETNRVWTWAADSFHYRLPFEFNFAEVFSEFINAFKWMKIVHEVKKKPFTADSPLPADIRIDIKEVVLQLDDDLFENLMQSSYELREDEVYECERRRQMLEERLQALKKANPLFPQTKMEELMASLTQKNSEIFIERWRKAEVKPRSLFVSRWTGWRMRAYADSSLHGEQRCVELMKEFDPLSFYPDEGLHFTTLWARAVEFDIDEWNAQFKDYPIPYFNAKDMHFFGTLVGAEEVEETGRTLRECIVPLPAPWPTHIVQRNISPLKFYYDIQCESSDVNATYGPCWEPCLSMISLTWNNVSSPSKDPSPPLPFWDKMRVLLHGRFFWISTKFVTTMLASPDPYNTTETVEVCWDDFACDWALGEIRVRCGLRMFVRTASRYDDSRVLYLPDLKLRIVLDWICSGDPHDHHSAVVCAPHKLPHYSSVEQHDSYRSFRSSALDVSYCFDVAGAGETGDRLPNVLLFANTFRCFEFLYKTLMMKNRNVRKGRIFGADAFLKPQLSKHVRNMQIAVNLPRFYVTYWMSHSSNYGFRVFSEGLNLQAHLKQSVQANNEDESTRRRKVYAISPQHVSATLWGTEIHVYGDGRSPSEQPTEETLLLGLSRVSYVRENNASVENALHRLTAHDLKMSWTSSNRDACLTIADGIHRAHMLRRILSNDAIKMMKLHVEEDRKNVDSQKSQTNVQNQASGTPSGKEQGHKRMISMSDANQSMLNQLIGEASTRLVAHCEQATDLPVDSLLGVIQCTADDVQSIHWQIDLLNSQLVLKGCETDGYLLVTAARASLTQKIHRNIWRNSQLLGKKSWSALLSGMQYFSPVTIATGQNKEHFRWLPREVIEERGPDTSVLEDTVQKFTASGEAVGGVVQEEGTQLQRIVSRCSCQIYFCYFSEELKTHSLEEKGVPNVEKEPILNAEDQGVDCFTLKHNMLEATSNSQQYEMVVDIVNNLVLFVDPKKKQLAENRRRLRFECQLSEMKQMKESIIQQQCEVREIVSLIRSLERQLFYLDNCEGEKDETKRKEIEDEMEEHKTRLAGLSDQLAIYISCYKQRQVEATRAADSKQRVEEDVFATVARRFEVCFEDCTWRLTMQDGQSALAEIQIRNFLYTRTMRIDNSGEHLFEVGSIRITNRLPGAFYTHTLHRDESNSTATRQPAIRILLRDLPPVGGINVKEHFEVNISPMVAELTYRFFEKMMQFFFPGRNIHNNNENNMDAIDENVQKFSFTKRLANGLSMRSSKTNMERKASSASKQLLEAEMDDIDRMRERADRNNHFLYIKIPAVPFVVSYKGVKDKNIIDIYRFQFAFPLCEWHEKNWTWLDLALVVQQRCKRTVLSQFMKQKLLRSRLTGANEQAEAISEEEKKMIALGTPTAVEKKKRK